METVTDMAAKRAELTPDKVAFRDFETGRSMTFAEVDAEANRLARAIGDFGAGPGDRVAIICHNRPEFFVFLFACQKGGFVGVPLNWRQPPAELEPILGRAQAGILLFDDACAATARALAERLSLFTLDLGSAEGARRLAAQSAAPVGRGAWRSSDAWYLLFTSGTTGRPKAVIYNFGMAWANAINIGQAIDLTSADKTVNFLPLFHTGGINLHALPVFLAGGTNHILRKFDVDAVLDLVAAGEVSVFFGVPAIYQAFSLSPRFGGIDFSHVRSWGCGGAPLPEPLIRLFASRGVRVLNGMGMTETGPTVFLMDAGHAETKIGSVGKPQILAEVRLVDDRGHAAAGEGRGELQFRGPGVTPGYFDDDAATAAAFAEGGWLKSGDVGYRDADGYYFIVDRIKDMFISGGENVYPAEVEHVLNGHPAVLEAVVIGVADDRWGEVGHAFLLLRPGAVAPGEPALMTWCRERLAAYKVPKRFDVVDDFPRTAAGKVQKHVLKTGLVGL